MFGSDVTMRASRPCEARSRRTVWCRCSSDALGAYGMDGVEPLLEHHYSLHRRPRGPLALGTLLRRFDRRHRLPRRDRLDRTGTVLGIGRERTRLDDAFAEVDLN